MTRVIHDARTRAWLKISDPERPVPTVDAGTRVLLPVDDRFDALADKVTGAGGQVRRVRYLIEDEEIAGTHALGWACRLIRPYRGQPTRVTGAAAAAARAAFDLMWQDHAPAAEPVPRVDEPTEVPADLAAFLPFPALNPAQREALPAVLGHDRNLLVVAPTGAGKTVIGMAAALRAVIRQGRKAAWLVPQRSLTDELDRELAHWRDRGLRVQRLSGEHTVDIDRVREADLWVATTEKFEAICRASAFRETLAEVGALVVDEVHMLGDPARGPVLEALLARVRDGKPGARIVGLSATVANAEEVAGWLGADLLRVAWRPSRLTWQLPRIARHADYAVTEAARTRLAAAITARVTADGGSVLVFCGSKRNVRRTALVIAASRGVDVSGVRPDNLERLGEVCARARVGLHYQGWEHRHAAERAFRDRTADVLVATSTVAAGVNLPARAVVIQDTQVGLGALDVGTVQQMFGRAGRIGAGEDQGWAFLIVEEHEHADWQARLVAGHTVGSRIQSTLPEHVLSEVVQGRVTGAAAAEQWWVRTLAYHQGQHSVRPLRQAIRFLREAELLAPDEPLTTTELGALTARMMVPPPVGHDLRRALADTPAPGGCDEAEELLIGVLAAAVPKLAQATVGDDGRAAVAQLLAAGGRVRAGGAPVPDGEPGNGAMPGDLARAALLVAARSPGAVQAGVPYTAMYPVLEEAPRYLHWIACQGLFGTVHPWWAVVAADLGRRVRWRRLGPTRGAGRLLWACEQMATAVHADEAVPRLWAAARERGYRSPDWTAGGRPRHCHLDRAGYLALLRERATACAIEVGDGTVRATGPAGSVLAVWDGPAYRVVPIRRGTVTVEAPASSGAAVFTWRGDHLATGWLAAYARLDDRRPLPGTGGG